jgi:cell division septum initiation protein DivIVA
MGASPHAFTVVRGRGYRPSQVDRAMDGLIGELEESRGRIAGLAAREEELAAEAERLRSLAESLPPQTYESLGERARRLLSLAAQEAEALREGAEQEAAVTAGQAEAHAQAVREAAEEEAELLRAEAEAAASRRVEAARSEAEAVRAAARDAAQQTRAGAEEALREAESECAAELAGQEREQAAELEDAERQLAERRRTVEAYVSELADRGEQLLEGARAGRAEAEEDARRWQEEARARGDKLLAAARVREEAVERETERVLWEHAERAAEMRGHMARVRSTLASITGRTPPVALGESEDLEQLDGVQGALGVNGPTGAQGREGDGGPAGRGTGAAHGSNAPHGSGTSHDPAHSRNDPDGGHGDVRDVSHAEASRAAEAVTVPGQVRGRESRRPRGAAGRGAPGMGRRACGRRLQSRTAEPEPGAGTRSRNPWSPVPGSDPAALGRLPTPTSHARPAVQRRLAPASSRGSAARYSVRPRFCERRVLMNVHAQPSRKPTGMLTMPLVVSGKTWKSRSGMRDRGVPETVVDRAVTTIAAVEPPMSVASSPKRVKRRQNRP